MLFSPLSQSPVPSRAESFQQFAASGGGDYPAVGVESPGLYFHTGARPHGRGFSPGGRTQACVASTAFFCLKVKCAARERREFSMRGSGTETAGSVYASHHLIMHKETSKPAAQLPRCLNSFHVVEA